MVCSIDADIGILQVPLLYSVERICKVIASMEIGTSAKRLRLVLAIALLGFIRFAVAQDALVLGVHPYQSPSKLILAYTPLAEYLSEQLKTPIELRISRDYQAHIDLIGKDELDIAYMGPSSYVVMVDQYGPKPLLARQAINGNPKFQGVIIIRASSSLESLGQLKGKRFAFGDPESTMSHMVPRYMLWKAGVNVDVLQEYRFLGSHDNVALAVLSGDFDAGAVKEEVYEKYASKGLKVLATTPPLSEHLFVASNHVNPQQVQQLRLYKSNQR